ncbi:hypothetical protein QQ045_008069 [Rhodiola kirilowii]
MDDLDAIRMEARDNFERSSQEVKYLTRQFFKSMDTNDDNLVDFQEIDTFFQDGNFLIRPLWPIDAKCDKLLMGKKRRTCVDCSRSATTHDNGVSSTYDLCRTCYHITHRYSHQLLKFDQVIFNGNVPAGPDRHFQLNELHDRALHRSTTPEFQHLHIRLSYLSRKGRARRFASRVDESRRRMTCASIDINVLVDLLRNALVLYNM